MTSQISAIAPTFAAPTGMSGVGSTARPNGSFGGMLETAKAAFLDVSQMQNDATVATEQFALGETDDIVSMMATVEKGELAFKTLLAVRSKLMAAFDEIRNMPV